MTDPICSLTLRDLAARIRTLDLSPIDVVDACLARIDALSRLNAFITVTGDEARARASEAAAEIRAATWRGPLHGVPVGIKDFYDTAGVRTTAAFEPFRHRVPAHDAVVVATLKQAGAIVIGKTNMHQLGMGTTGLDSAFGAAKNPWNDSYIPGGSSSGSAAAVAAGLCYATVDTDAIGSCRLPAACCGVVGFKGTYGAISSRGILEGEPADQAIIWLAHPGIITRSAGDTALVADVLAVPEARATLSNSRGGGSSETPLRIGIADNAAVDVDIDRVFRTATETLGSLGHRLTSASAPFDVPPMGDLRRIEADRAAIGDRAFKDIDVLVLPTTASPVPTVEAARANPQALSPRLTMFANYFGLPAISVPCGFDAHGLPVGLQMVARPWDDTLVLRLALQFETAATSMPRHPIP